MHQQRKGQATMQHISFHATPIKFFFFSDGHTKNANGST
uniref:Uncharacterized protein n=1 Tax=Rhizophora mucronata TaxID=61149 RepID=A0A2P2ISR9_RHIMU